jgi:transcriptional regulator with XRE-family HTH domain
MEDRRQEAGSSGFGALLRRYRLIAGLSQEALAERARMSVNGIGALERGYRRTPRRETCSLLADALGLNDEERREFEAAAARPGLVRRAAPGVGIAGFLRDGELRDIAALVRDLEQSKAIAMAEHFATDPRRQILAISFFMAIVTGIVASGAFLLRAHEKAYAPTPPSSRDLASLTKGLRAYWPIDDDGSAGKIRDVVHRYDGKIEGVMNWARPNGGNYALRFDGLSTFVSIPGNVIDTSKSYSISAMIFPFNMPRQDPYTVLSKDGRRASPFYFQINRYRFLELALTASDAVPPAESFAQAIQQPPLTGTWTHVVGTYDAVRGDACVFVNGAKADQQPVGQTFRAVGPLVIGASEYDKSHRYFYYGYIAQVYIYDRVLADREVAALYWLSMHKLNRSD